MEPLKLSDDLADELQDVLVKHDERAKDGGIALQYYAAVMGFVLAQQDYSNEEKKEFLNHLYGFSQHVLEDNIDASSPPQAVAEDAMGKWRPGDS